MNRTKNLSVFKRSCVICDGECWDCPEEDCPNSIFDRD